MNGTQPLTGAAAGEQKAARGDRPRGAWRVALWILQVITALGFLGAAAMKITGDPTSTASFDAMGWPAWTRYVIAILEILGAIALFVPRLIALAAACFALLAVGAVVAQLATGGSVVAPAVLLVLAVIIAWGRRRDLVAISAGRRPRRSRR